MWSLCGATVPPDLLIVPDNQLPGGIRVPPEGFGNQAGRARGLTKRSSTRGTGNTFRCRRPGFESARRDRTPAGKAHSVSAGFGIGQRRVHLRDAKLGGPPQTVEARKLPRQRHALRIVLVVVEPACSLPTQVIQRDPDRC